MTRQDLKDEILYSLPFQIRTKIRKQIFQVGMNFYHPDN